MKWMNRTILCRFLIIWSFFLVGLMYANILSNAHVGAVSFGPDVDIAAMSIAISKVKFGLDGGLGYKAVANELRKYLTSGSVKETIDLDENSRSVEQALGAAIHVSKNILTPKLQETNYNNYVTTVVEDIGYADFYELAFRIFGFNAFSTHQMYFSILFLSLFIYLLAFYQYESTAILMVLLTSCLFLVSNSMFSPFVPSFATNRFLSTLALFPLFHCVTYCFLDKKQTRKDIMYLVIQALLLAFTLHLRTSSSWMIVSLTSVLFLIGLVRYYGYPNHHYSFKTILVRIINVHGVTRIVATFFIVIAMIFIHDVSRSLTLNKIYFSDDVIPHHVFWHSAYLGLVLNPKWQETIPYPELAGFSGIDDNIAWKIYQHYQSIDPVHYGISPITGFYKIRIHERLMRKEFLLFAYKNPGYMLQLYFKYKPKEIFLSLKQMIFAIPFSSLSITIWGFLGSIFLAIISVRRELAIKITAAATVIWGGSLLPLLWAYPASYAICDQFLSTIFLFSLLFFMLLPTLISKHNVGTNRLNIEDNL